MQRKRLIVGSIALLVGAGTGAVVLSKWKTGREKIAKVLQPSGSPEEDGVEAAMTALADGNTGEAISILVTHAKTGNHEAQTMLGTIYLEGKLVKQDVKQAIDWFKKAAKEDHLPAMLTLGELFQTGELVKQNIDKATEFFEKAAKTGDKDAKLALAGIYLSHPEEEKEFIDKGQNLLKELARTGQAEAMLMLAQFESGRERLRESCDWYQKAAAKGSSDGAVGIGLCFQTGKGRKPNKVEFLRWTMTAAESDNANAQYQMGRAFLHGLSTSKDEQEAVLWFEKSAALGHEEAQYTYGVLLAKGVGIEQNTDEALQWLSKAKHQGHPDAESFIEQMGKPEYVSKFDLSNLEKNSTDGTSH